MPFHNEFVYCPICPPELTASGNKKLADTLLELLENNYSGCGVDLAQCPKCKKVFQISYRVEEVTEVGGEGKTHWQPDARTLKWAAEEIVKTDHVTIGDAQVPGHLVTELLERFPKTVAMILNEWAKKKGK